MKKYFLTASFAIFFVLGCNNAPNSDSRSANTEQTVIRPDWKKFYDEFNVTGSFVLFNVNESQYTYYNKEEATVATTPASTFKIPNSLISLETGAIADENETIKWDGVKRGIDKWNANTDLKTAYQNSTVWFYQELARRVGPEKMKEWVTKINYGNGNTLGAVDMFWLNDSLKISPMQQIDFLTRLSQNKLPFSKRSTDIMRKVMIAKDTTNFVLRAKTGWAANDVSDMGWYVGYIETGKNTYVFANRIAAADTNNANFGRARIDICYNIFKDLGIYKGK